MVRKAKHHICEGDIFQIVLSNRLEADFEGSLLNTYRILRTTNPSPYMFYFSGRDDGDRRALRRRPWYKLEDGVPPYLPLAGTDPGARPKRRTAGWKRSCWRIPKERAEHNMLVDLGRNDIGKISKFGTVEVEKSLSIERFPT